MVSINANYNAYVEFYKKHKDEIETTGTIKPDDDVKLVVDVTQIYNLMKNEGANAVLAVLEQLKHQGVAVEGPNIDLNTGTITFKIGNNNFELNIAEDESVDENTRERSDNDGTGKFSKVIISPERPIGEGKLTPVTGDLLPLLSDFSSYEDLRNFTFSNEMIGLLTAQGLTDRTYFSSVADVVAARHQSDFATVTKNQLVEEFITEYNKKLGSSGSSSGATSGAGATGSSTGTTTPANEPDESTVFAEAVKSINTIVARFANLHSDDIAKGYLTINIEFTVTNGVFSLKDEDAKKVYNKLKQAIKDEIAYKKLQDALTTLGGEKVLDSLIQTAWMATYDEFSKVKNINTESFIEKVLNNLTKILDKLETNPELLELFTGSGCYGDSSITKGVKHYGTKTTAGKDEVIIYGKEIIQYEDGTVHISNNTDDNDYQTTMKEVLARIKAKYPNIDEKFLEDIFRTAQKDALAICQSYTIGTDLQIPINSLTPGNNKIHMDDLVNLTLYCFDKLFIEKCMTSTVPPRTEKTELPATSLVTKEPEPAFTSALEDAVTVVDHIWNYNVDDISKGYKNIHTEFGLDKNGNIVFQNSNTTAVYNKLVNTVKNELEYYDKELLKNLGGDEVLKDLIQAAWISAYNKFPSSQSNNTEAFIEEVLACLKDILNAIKEHPERLDFYRMKPSYADFSLTSGLKHYNTNTTAGNDETIIYKGLPTVYDDGSVHIANDKDDKDYQATMNMLLSRLITKYASYVSSADVTSIFQKAQLAALNSALSNKNDCPYGTGNNNSRVEDSTRNWSGKDDRNGDKYKIHMDQLVQLTLYFFDKLLYEHMAKV